MKFITAILFILSGLIVYSMAELQKSNKILFNTILITSVSVVMLLSFISLVSGLLKLDTGIENILVKDDESTNFFVSGKPALFTLINFIIISIAGIIYIFESNRFRKIRALGTTVSAVGAVAICGYVLNKPFIYYSIPDVSIGMALNTAILFVLIGISLNYLPSEAKQSKAPLILSLNQKIILGFAVIILISGILGYAAVLQLEHILKPVQNDIPIGLNILISTGRINEFAQAINYYDEVLTQSARNYAFTNDIQWKKRYELTAPLLDKAISDAISSGDELDKETFIKIAGENAKLVEMDEESFELADKGNSSGAFDILNSEDYSLHKSVYSARLNEYFTRTHLEYEGAIGSEALRLNQSISDTGTLVKRSINSLTFLVLILVLVSGVFAFQFSYTISKPIVAIRAAIEEVSKGNFKSKLELGDTGELKNFANSFNIMIEELEKVRDTGEKQQSELENEIRERTKELNEKVREMEENKSATLNILEDIDQANRELVLAKEKLQSYVDDLKKLDTQKDQFISIAAHELKTPLTSIQGFSDLLKKQGVSENTELRQKYLSIIYRDAKRLGDLLTNILELSRMDLGTMKLAWEELDVKDLISEIKEQMDVIIKKKNLESEFSAEDGLPRITVDKGKTIQVISNLINNAVHYTDSGKITISAKRDGDFALFSVSDTGLGIPKEYWGRLFQRFYQVDNPLTRKIGGTGLGLSLSKGFVEAMGGRIWLDSEPGKGTTFYFTIPINYLESKKEVNLF